MSTGGVQTGPVSNVSRLGRREWREISVLLCVNVVLNAVAWTVLIIFVAPRHLQIGTRVVGFGLGVTAYTLGMRHAFDADHIAAIDNTTRKLMTDGKRPVSVGFWFALGHASVVALLAAGVAAGARFITSLTNDGSAARQGLRVVSTSASGLFLYLIGIVNLVALIGIIRLHRDARRGTLEPHAVDAALDNRGVMARILLPLMKSIKRPIQMYPIGLLFGIGFDTATEVTLLALAGSGAAAGLPWYAVMIFPLLFTAGMSLFDTLDGAFMSVAYRWAFANPIRKIYYNLTITGLSVAVALLIGTIELVGVLHDQLSWTDPISSWISGLDLNNVGFVVVGMFVVIWAIAIAYWRLTSVEERWSVNTRSCAAEVD